MIFPNFLNFSPVLENYFVLYKIYLENRKYTFDTTKISTSSGQDDNARGKSERNCFSGKILKKYV